MADCKSISAESGDRDRNLVFKGLVVGKADILLDTAVLWSAKLASLPREGLVVASPPSAADSLLEMEAVGYPMGTKVTPRMPVDINPGLLELKDIIETAYRQDYLELRASALHLM